MTTLLAVGDSDGVRRCDATCHNATGARCRCVCGGRYHGLGGDGALELVREDVFGEELAAELVEAGVLSRLHEQLTLEVPA